MESKTIYDWCEMFSITMLDHGGFDRTDPNLMERKFTLEQFNQGIIRSACKWEKDTWKRIDRLVEEVYGHADNSRENASKNKAQGNHGSFG